VYDLERLLSEDFEQVYRNGQAYSIYG